MAVLSVTLCNVSPLQAGTNGARCYAYSEPRELNKNAFLPGSGRRCRRARKRRGCRWMVPRGSHGCGSIPLNGLASHRERLTRPMATANSNSNSNSKSVNSKPTADATNLGAEIAAAMLAAFRDAAKSAAPVRAAAPDRDPWAGVQVGAWSDREREALTRLGWLQQGWSESRDRANARSLPTKGSRPGPEAPDPKRIARGEFNPDGFAAWQALAMVCARLQTYGRVSVQHVALIFHTMGASPATVGYLETPSRFCTKLQQTLKCKAVKTADGFFEAQPSGPQPMHDALAQAADRIISGK